MPPGLRDRRRVSSGPLPGLSRVIRNYKNDFHGIALATAETNEPNDVEEEEEEGN